LANTRLTLHRQAQHITLHRRGQGRKEEPVRHVGSNLIRVGAVRLAAATGLGAAAATVVGAAGAAATSGTSGTAGHGRSSVPKDLTGIKSLAQSDITKRVNSLEGAVTRAQGAKGLGAGQAALVAYLSSDITPLQQLNQKIQSDTTAAQAAADFGTIFSNFRVYRLVLPAARDSGDADAISATTVPALQEASTKAQQDVNAQNQSVLQPLIDDLNDQIATASGATSGLAATVLAYTPAQWNANNDLLDSAKQSVAQAKAAVQKGRSNVRQIWAALPHGSQAAATGGATTTTS
jgi:hypothetical protein